MAHQNPLVSLFKEQLENESAALQDQYGLDKRGDRLIWWYFLRIHELEDTTIEEICCDGGNDLGIDAVWIDEDNLVHFYQFKNPADKEAGFPDGEIDKVLSGLRLILRRKHTEIANEDLRGRVEEIYQSVSTGYRLHVVSSGAGLTRESKVKLDNFKHELEGPSDDFFLWEDVNISVLQDRFYRKTLPTVEDPIICKLVQAPYPVRSADHDSYVFHLRGLELAELYEQHGEQLLQQNIRVYEGDKATNNSIRATCTGDESGNFLHFNNGVTFLADQAAWDAFAGSVTLQHAQIVNGGQTVRVLHAAYNAGTLKEDVSVVVRVITSSGDKSFANTVAVNLNNQNRITSSFLRSNDPRIMQLGSSLASLGWYLERRQNEVKGLTSSEKREAEERIGRSLDGHVIRLKEGTQAYVSTFLRQPELAKKNPKLMFLGTTDGGYFDRIFNQDLTADTFVKAHSIASLVGTFVKDFMKHKRRKERVANWREDYATLLDRPVVDRHGSVLDQVIPQSVVFLSAVVFEEQVRQGGGTPEACIDALAGNASIVLGRIIDSTIGFAEKDPKWERSWPTLLKSQSFFDNYCSFRRGATEGATHRHSEPADGDA